MPDEPVLPLHHELIKIWQTLLHVEVVSINESFFRLGGDPQTIPAMLMEVKRATNNVVAPADFLKDPTISGLTRIILNRACSGGLFVPIQNGKSRDPFYFFHGDILGGGFYSKRLASFLGDEQPFHISPPIEFAETELPRVEELAAKKRRALQALQPHGPYVLGGFCVGAVMAYEVARQLEAAGNEVCTVVMIEPEIGDVLARSHLRFVDHIAARSRRPREKVDVFMHGLQKIERLRNVWHGSWYQKVTFVVNNAKRLLLSKNGGANPFCRGFENRTDEATNGDWRLAMYNWVLTNYAPKPYKGRVTMLLTKQHLEQAPFILKQWKKVAPQIQVEMIPGTHLSCITTHLADIGAKIRAEIDIARSAALMAISAIGSEPWVSF